MITILFTCHQCGIQRARAFVKTRAPQQDILNWMDKCVMPALLAAHHLLSPTCDAGFNLVSRKTKLDIAIPPPANEADGIGQSADPKFDPEKVGGDFMKSKGAN